MSVVSHIAGTEYTIEGRWRRQTCGWCGYRLIDEDLMLVMVPTEQADKKLPGWPVGEWIEVDEGLPTVFRKAEHEEGKFPDTSCMAVEHPRQPPHLALVSERDDAAAAPEAT